MKLSKRLVAAQPMSAGLRRRSGFAAAAVYARARVALRYAGPWLCCLFVGMVRLAPGEGQRATALVRANDIHQAMVGEGGDMKPRILVLGGVALAILAGVGGLGRAADEPVTIGLIVPLSPPGDPVGGQLIRRGAELGVDYVNTVMGGVLGGRKVRLAVEDSQGRPEAGIAAYRRLVGEEKAVAVTGFFHSSVNIAANEVAKELGVPTIGTQTGAADVTAKHYEVAFRTHVIDPLRAATWLGWIKQQGYKRVSIVAETTDYGIGLATETEEQNKAKNLGLEV